MKQHKALAISTTVMLLAFNAVAANEIPAYAMEMNSKRINGLLFRYTRFNAESPFPCLRLELIKPQDNWKIIERKDICEMNGLSLANDHAYSSFENLRFKNNALYFKFNYYLKASVGEFSQNCSIKIADNQINPIECANSKPAE